jgi:hypothetical protein
MRQNWGDRSSCIAFPSNGTAFPDHFGYQVDKDASCNPDVA